MFKRKSKKPKTDFPKLSVNSNFKSFVCFYIEDYAGSYPDYENPYLDSIKKLRAEAEKKGKIYYQMGLDEFSVEKLLEDSYQESFRASFGQGVLIYPFLISKDAELNLFNGLLTDIFPGDRFKIVFPESEIQENQELLVKEYPHLLERVVLL